MGDDTADRLEAIERRLADLSRRLDAIEGRPAAPTQPVEPESVRPQPARPTPPPARTPAAAAPPRPAFDLEELLGGRVLGWVGGSAIVLGAVFFLVMAVSRGWIDEPTRVLLAFVGSTALVGAGLYLYERQGQTQAALAAVGGLLALRRRS